MRMIFDLDLDKCTACGACAAACMDQNDTDLAAGDAPLRRAETLEGEGGVFLWRSVACMHCDDARCIDACPMHCLERDELGLVRLEQSACVGCRACARACPYDAVVFAPDGTARKCDGCAVRLECGYAPACVRVCPARALLCVPEAEYAEKKPAHSLRGLRLSKKCCKGETAGRKIV